MSKRPGANPSRAGVSTGDALLVLAALALGLSLMVPRIRRSEFRKTLDDIIRDVEAVEAAASEYHADRGRFPPDAEPGQVPDDLRGLLPPDAGFAWEKYTLDWEVWERVTKPRDPVDFPPPQENDPTADTISSPPLALDTLAGITVYTTREALLAALLERYGDRSFARTDRWTLVLTPER